MSYWTFERHCRWCSKPYRPLRNILGDSFCSTLCRVQLNRARKKVLREKEPIIAKGEKNEMGIKENV